jgi:hypothetical protein
VTSARRRKLTAVCAAVLLIAAGARWWSTRDPDTPLRHLEREGGGVLSSSSGFGRFTMAPSPEASTDPAGAWWGTFGANKLCLDGDADRVQLRSVRLLAGVAPLEWYVGVRTVTPELVARNQRTRRQRDSLSEIGSAYGQPLRFHVPGEPDDPLRGTFRRQLEGLRVDVTCKEALEFGEPNMRSPMHELMVVMRAGPQGAFAPGMEIDYVADGRRMTLVTSWEMAMCGSGLSDELARDCRGMLRDRGESPSVLVTESPEVS